MALYYDNSYLKTFSANVVTCVQHNDYYAVTLSQTAFYPTGGGQSGDIGTMSTIGNNSYTGNVLDTHKKGDEVIHITDTIFTVGDIVECEVNFERRFRFMQTHTGEHIMSGIIKSKFGYDNVGFHMGTNYTTMDVNGELSQDELLQLEILANKAIYENVPITSKIYNNDDEMPNYRSKKVFVGNIRIVDIQNYDTCACSGLHVNMTGEVGIIKIISSERHKGGLRIYMLCGLNALEDYTTKNKDIYMMSSKLSAKPNEVCSAVDRMLDENIMIKQEVAKYRNELYEYKANMIEDGTEKVCIFEEIEDLRKYCTLLCEKANIAAVFSKTTNGFKYAIGSNIYDMQQLGKKLNEQLNAKGGGKKQMIQGTVIATQREIEAFFQVYVAQ